MDKLTEIVWCDHVKVTPRPIVHTTVPHVFVHAKCYLIVEQGKVKVICSECFMVGIRSLPLPLI